MPDPTFRNSNCKGLAIPDRRWRRPPSVVLWGGRSEIDYQFGSARDRARTQRILMVRRMARRMEDNMRRIGTAMMPAFKVAVQNANAFAESMRKTQRAIEATRRLDS